MNITVEIPAKDIPDFESECCRKSYWKGFKKGVYAERMRNKSGCCCVFNEDETEVLQWCALHASLAKKFKQAKEETQNAGT